MQFVSHPETPAGVPRLEAGVSVRWQQLQRFGSRAVSALLRRTAGAPGDAESWRATIRQVIADLEHLNHGTEESFLEIGGKLSEFRDTVNRISSNLSELTDLVSGGRAQKAIEMLGAALDHSLQMRGHFDQTTVAVGGMREQTDRLTRTLSGIQQNISTLRTLGVLTRIETARLGSVGVEFGNLAEDVRALAIDVEGRIENALETAALLIPPIEAVMEKAVSLKEGRTKDLPAMISNIQANLASFREIQNSTHESASKLGSRYGAILEAFNDLTVSIQYHDITRQQIEHVIDILRSLCPASDGGRPDLEAILTLQASQLSDAAVKFARSHASIKQSLDEISGNVLEMLGESQKMAGLSNDQRASFFLQMEQGCGVALESLAICAKAEETTHEIGGGLTGIIGKMRSSIQELEGMEIEMQWMGLNATIRATHIGARGEPLSVIAGTMQQLAIESRQHSDSFVATLDGMTESANCLLGETFDDSKIWVDGMSSAVAEMHATSERTFARIAQVVQWGQCLSDDVSRISNKFSVGGLFAETAERARDLLKEVAERNARRSSGAPDQTLNQRLQDLKTNYTMQAQRDVHDEAVRGLTETIPDAGAADAEPAAIGSGEFGDNVELF